MIDLAERKLELIREISNEGDQSLVQAVVTYYRSLKNDRQGMGKKYAKPIRKRLDPEMLKHQQNFQGHDHAKIMEILQKVDIPESIETLLAQRTK